MSRYNGVEAIVAVAARNVHMIRFKYGIVFIKELFIMSYFHMWFVYCYMKGKY